MLNFSLFLLGVSFSNFASHLFLNTITVYVYLISHSLIDSATNYNLVMATRILFYPISGVILDKFNRKFIFVFLDLIQFVSLLGIFIYLRNFDPGLISFFMITLAYSIINSFSFNTNKVIIPQIFSGDNLIRASSFENFTERISRIIVLPFIYFIFMNKLEISILLSSILFLASAVIKSFIIVKEIKLSEIRLVDSISSTIKKMFLEGDIRKMVVSFLLIEMFFGVFCFSIVNVILKTSYHRSSSEMLSYIDSISDFSPSSVGLVFGTLGWMFYAFLPFILLIFLQMLEGTSIGRTMSIREKRLFKYFYAPISFTFCMRLFYQIFFMREGSCKYGIFSLKSETIDGSFSSFIMLGTVVGVMIALIFFQMFPWKYSPKKGMKLSIYLLVPISFWILCTVIYFGILEKGNVIQLTFALTSLIIFLTIAFFGYSIFFTSFYQNTIPINDLGKFSSFFLSLTILARFLGILFYKVLTNKYALLSIPVLFFLFTIWNAFSFRNFEQD